MVDEGWTLNDVIAFAEEYSLNLTIYDSNDNTIPANEYSNFTNNKVIYQQRQVGDTIINGISFYVKINAQYTSNETTTENDTE